MPSVLPHTVSSPFNSVRGRHVAAVYADRTLYAERIPKVFAEGRRLPSMSSGTRSAYIGVCSLCRVGLFAEFIYFYPWLRCMFAERVRWASIGFGVAPHFF
jgi:hypothetical protein